MADLATIFSWFETGDIPTQDQFRQTFSSFRHKEESVSITDVSGLNSALNNKLGTNHATDVNAHNTVLAKLDASNLNYDNVQAWRTALGVVDFLPIPENVGLVDDGISPAVFNKIQVTQLVEALQQSIEDIDANLISEDSSIFIENDTNNIESNVSFFTDEFENLTSDTVVLAFDAIQVLGVYDGGLRLHSSEYEMITNKRIKLLGQRKFDLHNASFGDKVIVDYTHLKTDL